MKTRETSDAYIVETDEQAIPCRICGGQGKCQGVLAHRYLPTSPGNPLYKPPVRKPSANMQRFVPGGRGPCVCSEAAVLDKVTGLCTACWRAFMWGGR